MISAQSENGFHSTLGNTIVRRVVCGEIHCRWTISPKHKHTNTNHNKHLEMQHSAKSDKRIKEYALRRSQFMFYLTLMLPIVSHLPGGHLPRPKFGHLPPPNSDIFHPQKQTFARRTTATPNFFLLFLAHFSWLFRLTAHGGHQGWEGGGA